MTILIEQTLEMSPSPKNLGDIILIFTREGLDVEIVQAIQRKPFGVVRYLVSY